MAATQRQLSPAAIPKAVRLVTTGHCRSTNKRQLATARRQLVPFAGNREISGVFRLPTSACMWSGHSS
jgi:hypothetical protein